jgi:hypothetical protein
MENLPVQRGTENVHIVEPYRRLLPRYATQTGDWNVHPKNIIPARPPTPGGTVHPAVIRARPVVTMPAFYTRTATVYERELWKMEKETFEKFDEAETTLHPAIVESLSQGTIRTINT